MIRKRAKITAATIALLLLCLAPLNVMGKVHESYDDVMVEAHNDLGQSSYGVFQEMRLRQSHNTNHVEAMIDRQLGEVFNVEGARRYIYYDPVSLKVEAVHLDFRPDKSVYGYEVIIEPGISQDTDISKILLDYYLSGTGALYDQQRSVVYINQDGKIIREARYDNFRAPALDSALLFGEKGTWRKVHDVVVKHYVGSDGKVLFGHSVYTPGSLFPTEEPSGIGHVTSRGSRAFGGNWIIHEKSTVDEKELISITPGAEKVPYREWEEELKKSQNLREAIFWNDFRRQEFEKWYNSSGFEDQDRSIYSQLDVRLRQFVSHKGHELRTFDRLILQNPVYYEEWRKVFDELPADLPFYKRNDAAHEAMLSYIFDDHGRFERFSELVDQITAGHPLARLRDGQSPVYRGAILERTAFVNYEAIGRLIEEERRSNNQPLEDNQRDILEGVIEAVEGAVGDRAMVSEDTLFDDASRIVRMVAEQVEVIAGRALQVLVAGAGGLVINAPQESEDLFPSEQIAELIEVQLEEEGMLADPGTRRIKEQIWVQHDRVNQLEKNLFYLLEMRGRGTVFPDSIIESNIRDIEEARRKKEILIASSGLDSVQIDSYLSWQDAYVYGLVTEDAWWDVFRDYVSRQTFDDSGGESAGGETAGEDSVQPGEDSGGESAGSETTGGSSGQTGSDSSSDSTGRSGTSQPSSGPQVFSGKAIHGVHGFASVTVNPDGTVEGTWQASTTYTEHVSGSVCEGGGTAEVILSGNGVLKFANISGTEIVADSWNDFTHTYPDGSFWTEFTRSMASGEIKGDNMHLRILTDRGTFSFTLKRR